jgi:uncharacterized protein YcbK (DUF882 family)
MKAVQNKRGVLAPHFRLGEFAVSSRYPQLAKDVIFEPREVERIRFACASILEPLRGAFAQPVFITSGKRTNELNRAVGGHPESDHLFRGVYGACDIVMPGAKSKEIAQWIIDNCQVDYLIVYPDFLHISFPTGNRRTNQIHYADGGLV